MAGFFNNLSNMLKSGELTGRLQAASEMRSFDPSPFRQREAAQQAMGDEELMARFSPEQRKMLASMPQEAAVQLITQTLFAEPDPNAQDWQRLTQSGALAQYSPQQQAILQGMTPSERAELMASLQGLAPPDAPPGAVQTLEWRAQQAGLQPGTPEYQQFMMENGGGVRVTNILGGEDLTPGQKKIDEAFADVYLDWQGGGYADPAKQIDQLTEAIGILEENPNVTGAMGLLPAGMQAFVNPEGTIAREAVEEVVQRSLREILGAQFTEREGERLIARAYNPLLPPAENRKRVQRLMQQIQSMADSRQSMVDYFDEHGTLRGFKGTRPNIRALEPLMEDEADTPAGAQPNGAAPAGQPSQLRSRADYDALPSGAEFIAPDGSRRRKP